MPAPLTIVQAYDRAPIAEVPADGAAELEAKLTRAAAAHRAGPPPTHARLAALWRLAELLAARQEFFTRLIAREGGKPWTDAAAEVTRAVDGVRSAYAELRCAAGREVPMGLSQAGAGRWAFTTREPRGVVAALSAFNHPLNLIVHQVVPAVAVGCPVIIKPAPAVALCCLELVALAREAGVDESACQTFITADNALAEQLATDARVAFVSFIGSAKVGWMLRGRLAPGTRCALEHGGAAPAIVDASADLSAAAQALAKGGYYHAGQVCVSVQRIFVQRAAMPELLAALLARVAQLRVGDPLDPATEVGPLIHPREVERVEAWTAEAVVGGATLHGGGRLSQTTLRPGVLVAPPPAARVSTQEIFGPLTCVYPFDALDDAVAAANALPFAFQASIFSRELAPALRAAGRLDAATVLVNDHTAFRVDWMPFAGRRQSGYGVGGIPATMQDMTHDKLIVLR